MRWVALLGAATACGDGLAAPDASAPIDATHDLVSVQVHSRYAREGSRVFFQRPDSTLVLATAMDARGRVQAYIPPHTMVTVELSDDSALGNLGHMLYTQLDVNPGDELVLDDGTIAETTTISVEIPADDGGFTYTLHAPCDAFITMSDGLMPDIPAQYQLTGCDAIADLLVTSENTGNFLFLSHAALAADVRFTGPFQARTDLPVRVDNVPPTLRRLRAQLAPLDGTHELTNVLPQLELELDGFEASTSVSWPAPTWDGQRMLVRLTSDDFTTSVPSVYAWGPTALPTTVDFGTDLPHAYLTTPTYVPESNLVGWLEADQGRLADAVLVELQWFSRENIRWRIFAQRDERTWVTVPVLPDPDLTPLAPRVAGVTNIAIDGGYERLRKLPLLGQLGDVRTTASPVSAWPMDATSGRVTFQSFTSTQVPF